jgi:hypothetical protein
LFTFTWIVNVAFETAKVNNNRAANISFMQIATPVIFWTIFYILINIGKIS